MNYSFLADITAVTHITLVVAVIIGLLISFRYKRFRPLEAGVLIVVIVLWSYYGNCPLTLVEQYFRNLSGEITNLSNVGFLPYYANKFMNLEIPSRIIQRTTFFTGGVIFAASIEWLHPYVNIHLFHLRKFFRKNIKYSAR